MSLETCPLCQGLKVEVQNSRQLCPRCEGTGTVQVLTDEERAQLRYEGLRVTMNRKVQRWLEMLLCGKRAFRKVEAAVLFLRDSDAKPADVAVLLEGALVEMAQAYEMAPEELVDFTEAKAQKERKERVELFLRAMVSRAPITIPTDITRAEDLIRELDERYP